MEICILTCRSISETAFQEENQYLFTSASSKSGRIIQYTTFVKCTTSFLKRKIYCGTENNTLIKSGIHSNQGLRNTEMEKLSAIYCVNKTPFSKKSHPLNTNSRCVIRQTWTTVSTARKPSVHGEKGRWGGGGEGATSGKKMGGAVRPPPPPSSKVLTKMTILIPYF